MPPPPAEARLTSSESEHSAFNNPKRKYRNTTIYDAVAGRAFYRGLISKTPVIASTRDTASSSTVPVPPEEVLFRSRGAPQRYEETDFYWANEKLPLQGAELPDSDLLKAVHAYASRFYGRRGEKADFHSLDETALMAFGILLEEWADGLLGRSGEGVFVEGEAIIEGEAVEGGGAIKGREAVNEGETVREGETLNAIIKGDVVQEGETVSEGKAINEGEAVDEGGAANEGGAVSEGEEVGGKGYASEILGDGEREDEEEGQRRKRRKV